MDSTKLRDLLPNDRTEGWLIGCAILAVIMLASIVPLGLGLLFWGLSGTR
jgi:hypothetical protein